jgi:hypothetical protein
LYEAGTVRVNPTGSVTVLTGSHSHGQGHETTFAQLVVEALGVDYDNVEVVHGDTGKVPFGMGTYGSRSAAVGGVALMNALEKIRTKARKIAAHLLEASEDDIEFKDGQLTVTASLPWPVQIDPSHSATSPWLHTYRITTRWKRWSQDSRRLRFTIRRISRFRPVAISVKSKSIRIPELWMWSNSPLATISGASSIP